MAPRTRGAKRAARTWLWKDDSVKLTVERILEWADSHKRAKGVWPTANSGTVGRFPWLTWRTIDTALCQGHAEGLAPTSLRLLLTKHRGPEAGSGKADLTVEQILGWANAHFAATQRWPNKKSGPVANAQKYTWEFIDTILDRGGHGLLGGTSLRRLLEQHRAPLVTPSGRAATIEQVLGWADAHFEATGCWPTAASGPVADAPGYTWERIDGMLLRGRNGLPQGLSLSRLLRQYRVPGQWPGRDTRPPLTVDLILSWADSFHAASGCWPDRRSGPIANALGESWWIIDGLLKSGLRGLPGGSSLRRLLLEQRGASNSKRPRLCPDQIVAWADAHHAATGTWPLRGSGPVTDAPGEQWSAIDRALRSGHRGLPGGSSLSRLLKEQRLCRKYLTLDMIRAWAEAHRAATGQWPDVHSGAVAGAPRLTWQKIEEWLRNGARGKLLDSLVPGARPRVYNRRPLNVDQIFAWADAHRAATGRWPRTNSGPIADAPGERWDTINEALRSGLRGLPTKTSLKKLLAGRALPTVASPTTTGQATSSGEPPAPPRPSDSKPS
jgi:hypothetical protein